MKKRYSQEKLVGVRLGTAILLLGATACAPAVHATEVQGDMLIPSEVVDNHEPEPKPEYTFTPDGTLVIHREPISAQAYDTVLWCLDGTLVSQLEARPVVTVETASPACADGRLDQRDFSNLG